MSSPAPLDYAKPQRRRIRFRWLALAVLVVASPFLWHSFPQLRDQAKLRWTIHQCLSCSRDINSVAYEHNEYHGKQLAAQDPAYLAFFPTGRYAYGQFRGAYKPVDPWEWMPANVRGQTTLFASQIPLAFRQAFSPFPMQPGARATAAPLFVHQRSAKGRPARLVVIELLADEMSGLVDCCVIDPGPPWGSPSLLWQGRPHELGETIPGVLQRTSRPGLASEPPASVYFGQIDPADPAKFTIRVAVLNTQFTFEGRLMPDDTIEIEGPLLSEVLAKIGAANPEKPPR